eukprot:tig00020902_g15009.t1
MAQAYSYVSLQRHVHITGPDGPGELPATPNGDGKRIISGSNNNSVRVWDAETGAELLQLQGHTDSVTSVAVLANKVFARYASGAQKAWTLRVERGALSVQEVLEGDEAWAQGSGQAELVDEDGTHPLPFHWNGPLHASAALPGGGTLFAIASPAGVSVERVPAFRCTRRIQQTASLEAQGAKMDAATSMEPRLRRLLLQLGAVNVEESAPQPAPE